MHTAIAAFVLLFMSRQVFQRAEICMGHITFANALTSPVEQWQLRLFIASLWHVTWQETADYGSCTRMLNARPETGKLVPESFSVIRAVDRLLFPPNSGETEQRSFGHICAVAFCSYTILGETVAGEAMTAV